ncbi:MAG: hypothetical protein ACT4QC_20360 [Planctomycetaceae bacterium]
MAFSFVERLRNLATGANSDDVYDARERERRLQMLGRFYENVPAFA